MKYPALRLYFRGTDTIIDIPNAYGVSYEELAAKIQSNITDIPEYIHGKDQYGNANLSVIENWDKDIAFCAAIQIDDGKTLQKLRVDNE